MKPPTLFAAVLLVSASPLLAQDAPGAHFITAWDLNEDGQVTLEEFTARTADWLALIDRNGDGVVTVADFGPRG